MSENPAAVNQESSPSPIISQEQPKRPAGRPKGSVKVRPLNEEELKALKESVQPPKPPAPGTPTKPPKIPISKLIVNIALAMNKQLNDLPPGFPKFPIDYRVCKSIESLGFVIVRVEDGKTAVVEDDDEVIESDITQYLSTFPDDPAFEPYQSVCLFTSRIVRQFKKMKRKNLIAYPKCFGFLEDEEICFNRAWYEPEKCEENDPDVKFIMDMFYERVDQYDSLIMEYGANLINNAPRKSCPVLLGLPDSGKSSFDFINQYLLGAAHKSAVADNLENSFGLFHLIGAKSIYLDEVKLSYFQSSLFLRLTGKKEQPFNRKFKDERSAEFENRTWASTNYKPDISKPEVRNRLNLYLVTAPKNNVILTELAVKERIKKGIPKFAYIAMKRFIAACPNLEPVPYDREKGLKMLTSYKDPADNEKMRVFKEIHELYFVFGPSYYMKCTELTEFAEEYRGKTIKTSEDVQFLRKSIQDAPGVSQPKTIRHLGKVFRGITGVALVKNPTRFSEKHKL